MCKFVNSFLWGSILNSDYIEIKIQKIIVYEKIIFNVLIIYIYMVEIWITNEKKKCIIKEYIHCTVANATITPCIVKYL